ncbi:unnamed protein product [Auanema sp. JU1783]|nr:unnamed protein product [Auanema sp. JU1783]
MMKDRLTCDDQKTYDRVRDQFEEYVLVDNRDWEFKKEMEEYDAETFIEKAQLYHSKSPPDIIQAAEKLWFSAVYAVKKLFIMSGGIGSIA